MAGTLFGIGVGPGDPELLTLKAARLLGEARTIAFFQKRKAAGATNPNGNAYATAKPHVRVERREIAMVYPVTTEHPVGDRRYDEPMTAFYEEQAALLAAELDRGEDIAVLAEGDPFFYGSFMHLFHRLADRFPTVVVPGVTAMSACWTAAARPITYGDDVLSVIPATLPEATIAERLRQTDAAVLMKLGRNLAKASRAVAAAGLMPRAVYIERCGMAGERILPLATVEGESAPYFTIILVPGEGRRL